MKLIHCADVHLGSKMESKLPPDKAAERKAEVRTAFGKMVRYAADNDIRVILLAGDVFDSDRPLKKDKDFFYSVVRSYPNIDFLYLRGNHDSDELYTLSDLGNLKTFSSDWTVYSYNDADIYGVELSDDNARSIYTTLKTKPDRTNIVMLHGQISDVTGKDKVNLARLRDKHIDYLALGHVHAHSRGKLDNRGVYAYCGCLEGRGFDEAGEKGFVVVDTEHPTGAVFVPNSVRKIEEVTADIGSADDLFSACRLARAAVKCDRRDLIRLNLTGEISFDGEGLAREVEKQLAPDYYFVSVKDRTVRKFDVAALAGDKSLRGEFIRTVLADESTSDEQKSRIISAGLKALAGREVD